MELATPRRDFEVRQEDRAFLESLGITWETIKDGGNNWVLLHDYVIPEGFNVSAATIGILLPASYPIAAIDMVYVRPPLTRSDGTRFQATNVVQKIGGLEYQRWSRHRTAQNPWRVGLDDIASHISLVDEWFRREVNNVG